MHYHYLNHKSLIVIDIVGMYSNIGVLKKLKSSARNHAAAIKSMCFNSLRFRSQSENSLKMSAVKMPTPSELKVRFNFQYTKLIMS